MDKETYKVAKTILEKFAPEQVKKNTSLTNESTPVKSGPLAPFNSALQNQTGNFYWLMLTLNIKTCKVDLIDAGIN